MRGVALLAGALAGACLALAQESPGRTIEGQVLDEKDKAVATALVHLKDLATGEKLTAVTSKQGRYSFGALNEKADYEIYAEKEGRRSSTRTVSRLDTRKKVVIHLTLKLKEEPPPPPKQEEKKP